MTSDFCAALLSACLKLAQPYEVLFRLVFSDKIRARRLSLGLLSLTNKSLNRYADLHVKRGRAIRLFAFVALSTEALFLWLESPRNARHY
ncbi:MAG: hypothetical protein HY231_27315 [Acidobacteria bacterium]|nr:hypothetical protein [Acidobacteriota bacterium]